MREWNGRYRDDKGGLAWLLWQGGVVGDVVVLSRINVGLGVEEGGETVNTGQTSITKYNKAKRGARGDLTQY